MMHQPQSDTSIKHAANAFGREATGGVPESLIHDLLGSDNYRRAMRCPDTESLAAYAEEVLPLERTLEVAMHVRGCPVCHEDVADLRRALQQQATQVLTAMAAWQTPFIGREDARRALGEALARGDRQSLTVVAPSGAGKSRLMLETAVEYASQFPDGVWYVPLADCSDVQAGAAEIARTVELPLTPETSPEDQLHAFFDGKRVLLVLDDLPYRSPIAHDLGRLLGNVTGLCCLAATTGPLDLPGEQAFSLPPLPTPPRRADPERLLDWESMRLFAAHIQSFQPDYRLTASDARIPVALCARAGGIPLAIEIAAARAREMSPDEVFFRLAPADSPPSAPGTALDRMIAWSFGLLSAREQTLLAQLCLFTDSFAAEQAAAVSEDDAAGRLLENLWERALLQRMDQAGQARYRLPSSVRAFAAARLQERLPAVRRRYVSYFLRYVQAKTALIQGPRQVEAVEALSVDLPNIRAAVTTALEDRSDLAAAGFGSALYRYLLLQGLWSECDTLLCRSVEAARRLADTVLQMQTRLALARCRILQGEYVAAEPLLRAVQEEAERSGHATVAGEARLGLGNIAQYRAHYVEAAQLFAAELERAEKTGDARKAADCRYNLGYIAWKQGDYPRSERLLQESLRADQESGDRTRIGSAYACLGQVALEQGRLEDARSAFEACLRVRRELGDARGIASALCNIGRVWKALGDNARAQVLLEEAARGFERIGDRRGRGQTLANVGDLALALGDTAGARRALEESQRLLEAAGDPHDVAELFGMLGRVAQRENRRDEAIRLYRESLHRMYTLGDRAGVSVTLFLCGQLLAAGEDRERGTVILYVARVLCAAHGRPEQADAETALAKQQETLESARVEVLRRRAATMSLDEVIELTLLE